MLADKTKLFVTQFCHLVDYNAERPPPPPPTPHHRTPASLPSTVTLSGLRPKPDRSVS